MNKPKAAYQPHLRLAEYTVPPGREWSPRGPDWSLIQIVKGSGCWLQPQLNRNLEPGSTLLVAGNPAGKIRASRLGALSLHGFTVRPSRLTGVMTLSEQRSLGQAAAEMALAPRILPPNSPAALKMRDLCASPRRTGLGFRLKLLELFAEALGSQLEPSASMENASNARDRLEQFLKKTPSAELLELNFHELAQKAGCTPRHLSRTFRQLAGMSFREKRAQLRLARACELLVTSDSKVLAVALESGYNSLSSFNLMFARRFGASPSKWREQNGVGRQGNASAIRRRASPFASNRDGVPPSGTSRGAQVPLAQQA